ncbi:hypothetical protein [Bradyrhizobium sp. SZCCHNRI1003]|uniref:hypothetical protein n=1 Tax=Bradyrhizobium sp. SZCCHNRI1003 TaxID=3057275 RepID=UPI0029169C46|nr:hypothetical protein [Bradyrhizobium sp. SZCCHNRI1003]
MTNKASSFPNASSMPPLHRYGGVLASTPELAMHALGDAYWVEGTGTVLGLPAWPKGPPIHLYLVGNPTFVNSSKLLMPGGQSYTFSPGDSCWVLPLGDGVWRVLSIDIAALAPGVAGWRNAPSTPKTTTYPVVTGDNGATLHLGNNAFYTASFGPASVYPANFSVMLRNTDTYSGIGTGRGKRILLDATAFILYPGQNVMVFNANGVWDYFPKKQRWVQAGVIACVDTAGGAFNAVDGLAAGAGAFNIMQDAAALIWYGLDQVGGGATIAPTAGQTFAQSLNLGGQPLGGNLVTIQGNGGAFNWQTPAGGGTMLAVGDHAQVALSNINYISSNNVFGHAAIALHNDGLADVNAGITFTGGGLNDSAIFLDNNDCIITIANGFTCSNTFGDLIHFDGGGAGTISGVIAPSGSTSVGQFIHLKARARVSMGTPLSAAGYTSIGVSMIEQQSLLITNGIAIPGGTTTATGGLVI